MFFEREGGRNVLSENSLIFFWLRGFLLSYYRLCYHLVLFLPMLISYFIGLTCFCFNQNFLIFFLPAIFFEI